MLSKSDLSQASVFVYFQRYYSGTHVERMLDTLLAAARQRAAAWDLKTMRVKILAYHVEQVRYQKVGYSPHIGIFTEVTVRLRGYSNAISTHFGPTIVAMTKFGR